MAHVIESGTGTRGVVVLLWREESDEILFAVEQGNAVTVLNLAERTQTPLRRADLGLTRDANEAPRLVMASANGAELWSTYDSGAPRYFRWTAEEGFKLAAIDAHSRSNASFGTLSAWWNLRETIRDDGRIGPFESRDDPEDDSSYNPDNLYAYDLVSDTVRVSRFAQPAGMSEYVECGFEDWVAGDTVEYHCWLSARTESLPIILAGPPPLSEIAYFPPRAAGDGVVGLMSRVGFGGPTDPLVLHPDCGC